MIEICRKILLTTFVILSSCNTYDCISFEKEIKKKAKMNDRTELKFNEATNFLWDNLYIINGPEFPKDIENLIGLKYGKGLDDGDRLFIFVKDSTIIKEYTSSCYDVSYFLDNRSFEYQDSFFVEKFEQEGYLQYRVTEKNP